MMKSTKASTKSHDSHHTKTAPVDVQKLENLESFQQTLLNSGPNLIVIAFYSAWSVPSIKMNKELDYMQADYSDVNFYKIDVDTNGEVSEAYFVKRMPTLYFIKHEKTVGRLIEPNFKETREMIELKKNLIYLSLIQFISLYLLLLKHYYFILTFISNILYN